MQRLIYGVFPSRENAEAARQTIHERALDAEHIEEAASAAIHVEEVRPNDLPPSGTFATRSALAGGLAVGTGVGVMLGLLMTGAFSSIGGPATILGSKPVDVVFVTLAAGSFGAILSGIAGTAGKRAQVRELEEEVTAGRVLLTLEAPKKHAQELVRMMSSCGALRAGAI
ncbi:hypothetical protein ENSA5_04120 [Enhygromyxa salina]|uniref:DUF1269 domain-containing protein n=1 Tax=Enhygromyxa salina TaxID=215803 RepID=A0A2S9YJL4_9BACT|nr:hypothetical protein [Enhygromyxa salina]PRQ05293.1 hypothetical protein ENSA5_04120 [Enhygromyxa salina]